MVLPPGYDVLRERLLARNLDSLDSIDRRMRNALAEVQRYQQYEYVIVNEDVARASAVLGAIILEKRACLERMRDRIEVVLDDFSKVRS